MQHEIAEERLSHRVLRFGEPSHRYPPVPSAGVPRPYFVSFELLSPMKSGARVYIQKPLDLAIKPGRSGKIGMRKYFDVCRLMPTLHPNVRPRIPSNSQVCIEQYCVARAPYIGCVAKQVIDKANRVRHTHDQLVARETAAEALRRGIFLFIPFLERLTRARQALAVRNDRWIDRRKLIPNDQFVDEVDQSVSRFVGLVGRKD
jgi:hypothetical protein